MVILEKIVFFLARRHIMWPALSTLALGALLSLGHVALGSLGALQGTNYPYPSDMMIEGWQVFPWIAAALILAGIILQQRHRVVLAVVCYALAIAACTFLALAALKVIGGAFSSALP